MKQYLRNNRSNFVAGPNEYHWRTTVSLDNTLSEVANFYASEVEAARSQLKSLIGQ